MIDVSAFAQCTEFGHLYHYKLDQINEIIDDLNKEGQPTNVIYHRLLNEMANLPLFKQILLKMAYDCFEVQHDDKYIKIDSINHLSPQQKLYVEIAPSNNTIEIRGERGYYDRREYKLVPLDVTILKKIVNEYFGVIQ